MNILVWLMTSYLAKNSFKLWNGLNLSNVINLRLILNFNIYSLGNILRWILSSTHLSYSVSAALSHYAKSSLRIQRKGLRNIVLGLKSCFCSSSHIFGLHKTLRYLNFELHSHSHNSQIVKRVWYHSIHHKTRHWTQSKASSEPWICGRPL